MATNKSLPSILLPVAIGAAIGFAAATVLYQSETCKAPARIDLVDTNDGSIHVSWDTKSGSEAYLVWARDSSLLTTYPDSVSSSITVTGHETELPGLLPNHGYLIEVFSICRKDNKFLFSKIPAQIGAHSGWIIIEDVVEAGPGSKVQCPFNTCDTLVTLDDNCFNWDKYDANYTIEVFRINSDGVQETSPALRTYMDKSGVNDSLRINMYSSTPCTGAKDAVGLSPTKAACAGTSGCASTLYSMCGQLTDTTGVPVCFGIKIGFTNCCVMGLDKAKFKVVIHKCHFVPPVN